MKLCFNEGTSYQCKNHSLMADLEACEKYGFDYIDIRFDVLDHYLKEHPVEELAEWFRAHRLKPFTYSAFCFFNWKKTEAEKEAVFAEMKRLIPILNAIDMKTVAVVPSFAIEEHASVDEIKEDAVAMLARLADMCAPHGIRLSLEFCGAPACTINRFDTAYDIVRAVDRENVGIVLDQFHFYAMGSCWEDLEKADGHLITNYHLDDAENLPVGAPYNTDAKRLWPGDGCLDMERFTTTLEKIGFDLGITTIEVFRPAYYELSVDENVKTAMEKTRAFVDKYFA
ncbi:MAG: sugar phosphate isomerase/epimerase family protein [Intestinibacillus sp.]